jgi:hypothetical protein
MASATNCSGREGRSLERTFVASGIWLQSSRVALHNWGFSARSIFVWAARAGLEEFRKNVRGVLLGIFPNLTLRSSL